MSLETLYEARIDSPRSDNYYDGFDCCLGEITFCLTSGETGDMIKEYTVLFNEETGEIDQDVVYNTEYDGGYCVYSRLPKALRAHIEAIVEACKFEESEYTQAIIEDFEEGYNPLGKFKSDKDNEEETEMADLNIVEKALSLVDSSINEVVENRESIKLSDWCSILDSLKEKAKKETKEETLESFEIAIELVQTQIEVIK